MATKNSEWFAVKGLFRWYLKDGGNTARIEERIVLFRAESGEEAIDCAEREAIAYCADDPKANYRIEALDWWNAYQVGEEHLGHGVELYSRLMDTSLSGDAFVRRYYPKSQDH